MTWKEATDGAVVIVSLAGDIDLQHSPRLRELLRAKAAQRAPALVLDFTGVRYIDSSGLATLVEYYQMTRRYSGRMLLAGLNQRVRSVFDLVRLSEIFPIYPNLTEARAALPR